ncbi:5-oxoprolinase subunit PxpB [Paenibacillus sp. GSMTC-2017]|nr:5-oxoprolinase subunit PxpB [Paenibacillus sp. GSMTC-2017]
MQPLGDRCVLIRLGDEINEETHHIVIAVTKLIEGQRLLGISDIVPAYTSVAVHYDPLQIWRSRSFEETDHATIYATMCARLNLLLRAFKDIDVSHIGHRTIEIPVCYGGKYGPDLGVVAEHCGLNEDEVISIHSSGNYLVYMIGFAPAFPYLGGMSERIATPRRQTPRTVIPVGSVGIAGVQTGVYPIETPGGWQLIGRTPLRLFQPQLEIPSLLEAGDHIRFIPIAEEQYEGWHTVDENVASLVNSLASSGGEVRWQ